MNGDRRDFASGTMKWGGLFLGTLVVVAMLEVLVLVRSWDNAGTGAKLSSDDRELVNRVASACSRLDGAAKQLTDQLDRLEARSSATRTDSPATDVNGDQVRAKLVSDVAAMREMLDQIKSLLELRSSTVEKAKLAALDTVRTKFVRQKSEGLQEIQFSTIAQIRSRFGEPTSWEVPHAREATITFYYYWNGVDPTQGAAKIDFIDGVATRLDFWGF